MESAKAALKEWRSARLAIFKHNHKSVPDTEQLALWERLANAEYALMKVAIDD